MGTNYTFFSNNTNNKRNGQRNNRPNPNNGGGRNNPVSYNVKMSQTMAQAANRPLSGSDILDDDYTSNDDFSTSLLGYDINPGLDTSFPALSFQSKRYDYYEFTSLQFVWRPTSAVTSTKGMVVLAFDPNPNARVPSDLGEIMAYEAVVGESIYRTVRLNVPPSMLRGRRYVRHGPVKDHLSLFDPGMLIIANQGTNTATDGTKLGVIEVHYTVRFTGYHLSGTTDFAPHQLEMFKMSSTQTGIAASTKTLIEFDTSELGGLGCSINSNLITPGAGLFKVSGRINVNDTGGSADGRVNILLYKNGVELPSPQSHIGAMMKLNEGATSNFQVPFLGVIECDEDDTLGLYIENATAGTTTTVAETHTYWIIEAVN